jgi:hypothetical protein
VYSVLLTLVSVSAAFRLRLLRTNEIPAVYVNASPANPGLMVSGET